MVARRIRSGDGFSRGTRTRTVPVDVTCEDCGKPSRFPFAQKGSVQSCPDCRAYVDVDVGDEVGFEGWDE